MNGNNALVCPLGFGRQIHCAIIFLFFFLKGQSKKIWKVKFIAEPRNHRQEQRQILQMHMQIVLRTVHLNRAFGAYGLCYSVWMQPDDRIWALKNSRPTIILLT